MADTVRSPRPFPSRLSLLLGALVLGACDPEASVDAGPELDGGSDAGPSVVMLPDEREACARRDSHRIALFGDLHVHTSLSFDAAAYDVRSRPADAYRFARGETIGLPPYDAAGEPTRTARLSRPLDFAAVTDHSEFLAETDLCTDPASAAYGSRTCATYRDGDFLAGDYGEFTSMLAFGRRTGFCLREPEICAQALGAAWQEVQDAAEAAYDRTSSCTFTSFVAYEWSGSRNGSNAHRNVIFRNRSVPTRPVSYLDVTTAEGLWGNLEGGCLETGTPCDVLAIPHNANLSAGTMFVPVRDDDAPYDAAISARRAALEPLVEIYQHKGASECVFASNDPLASEDEGCAFEELHPLVCRGLPSDPEGCTDACTVTGGGIGFLGACVDAGDMARGAWRTGLRLGASLGANPFAFGVIGSTDTHQALAGGTDEATWPGHLGDSDDDAAEQLFASATVLIRGLTASPGGLAVVYAESNDRESLFAALRRRETYATSGTRILVRTFAGPDVADDLCSASDFVDAGDASGVPMGGEIHGASAMRLAVSASADPMGAPLEAIEIVKLWVDAAGATHESVTEIARSTESGPVDPLTCTPAPGGSDTLCAVFTDPDFDSSEHALYYARIREVQTCRWSGFVCRELAVDCASIEAADPRATCCTEPSRHVIAERAWTSPVFYLPAP
jgi:hypothetical protein